MNFALVQKIIVILIDILGVYLGFWVYFANRKSKVNRFFTLLTLFILLWISFAYFASISNQFKQALLWRRLAFAASPLAGIFGYFFTVYFLREEKRFPYLDKFIICIGIFSSLSAVFTDWIIKAIELKDWGAEVIFGKGIVFPYGMVTFLAFWLPYILFKKYTKLSKTERLKIQYLLIGIFIFIGINLIFNVCVPIFSGSYKYYQFGDYSAIFLLGFTAYAIVKRHLFGIRVVLTEIFVVLIAVLLFINFLVSKSTFEYIWKGALFITFLFFGYLLVKSVVQEIKYREELQQAYQDLQKLDRAKSEFISIVSHQLRTPLTAIKGYISMMIEGVYGRLSKKILRPLKNVYQSNERLIKLVNDFLNLSRIETGRIEMNFGMASIEDVVKSVVEELKNEARNKNIYLKWEKSPVPLVSGRIKKFPTQVYIDKEKIRQVILNIIDNAIRYTTDGGITIKTEIKNNKCKIEIKDTGEGMTHEEIRHLFESFSRGKAGTRLWTEGAGLGLYIAKKFVDMHKGKIWAESPGKGKGSTFHIELPTKQTT